MRIFKYILPIVLLVSAYTLSYAQPDLEQHITLNLHNQSVEKALREISKLTDIHFSYSSRKIPVRQRITIQVSDQPVRIALDQIAERTSTTYQLVEKQIIILPAAQEETPDTGPDKTNRQFTLSGYVRDQETGEVLIGATVFIPELVSGTITNTYGFYSITLPAGDYTAGYAYMGYKRILIPVRLTGNRPQNILMEQEVSSLAEVTITTSDDDLIFDRVQMSEMNLEPAAVAMMPALMGEVDVIKSLQSVPGISLMGDGSTLFHVRGGNKDQNLILLDDAPIYTPSHMLGFFSTFIPDAVKDIKVYKGDFPAEFGGKISSLVDIKTRDGNMNRLGVSGSFGLISAKAAVEGPIVKDKSSFLITGRRSYFKWFLGLNAPALDKLHFQDLSAKFNIRLSDKDRLFVSGYAGKDVYQEGLNPEFRHGISWSNVAGTLRWNHLFNDRLFSNTTIYGSAYDYSLLANVAQNHYWHAEISNYSIKSDFTWYMNPFQTVKAGGSVSAHNFGPGNFYLNGELAWPLLPYVSRKYATEIGLYASHSHDIDSKISIRYGLRMNVWLNSGKATEYTFDSMYNVVDTATYAPGKVYNSYVSFEPRLGLSYRINPLSVIKASYSRTTQHIHLITNSISPFTTLEVWLPSSPQIKPQKADLLSVGWFRKFTGSGLEFSVEGFFKKMHNQIDYVDHAQMMLNPAIEGELRFGTAEAAGLEFLLKRGYGKLNGWIGYSLSKTEMVIEGINGGRPFAPVWDRPHDLSVFVSYAVRERINLSANWYYMTGAAFSTPSGFYYYNDQSIPLYTEKNGNRLPDYHRLDFSVFFDLNKKDYRFDHNLVLTIFNLYGRKNPMAINFNKVLDGNGDPVIPANLISQPDLVTTHMFLTRAVPSLTYSFKF